MQTGIKIFVIMLFFQASSLIAQELPGKKMIISTFSYSKWGPQHGLLFMHQNKKRFIFGYELAVNVNTSYLQNRFRPVNQLVFGYNLMEGNRFISLSPLVGFTADTYQFNQDFRMNKLSLTGGYIMKFGKGRFKITQMSFIGIGKELHWENVVSQYLCYKTGIGFEYEL
jgi:hypothetical protein